MIKAKPSIPIRLFVDLPFYDNSKGVQAEIYHDGLSTGGSSLLTTKNLTRNTSVDGRYEAFYTPPENYDHLQVRYVVYTDDTYAEKDLGIGPFNEQMVLNDNGGGSLGFIGDYSAPVVKPLEDVDVEKIVNAIWKKNIKKIDDPNSAAVVLKQSLVDYNKIDSSISGAVDKIVQVLRSIEAMIVSNFTKIFGLNLPQLIKNGFDFHSNKGDQHHNTLATGLTEIKGQINERVDELTNKVNSRIDKLDQIARFEDLVAQIKQSIDVLENINSLDSKMNYLLMKQKLEVKDFDWFVKNINDNSHKFGSEQTQFITDYVQNKVNQIVTEADNQSIKKILDSMEQLTGDSNNKNSSEYKKIHQVAVDLQGKVADNEKKLKELDKKYQSSTKEVITTIQNNVLALAKLIEKLDTSRANDFSDTFSSLDRIKKNLNNTYV